MGREAETSKPRGRSRGSSRFDHVDGFCRFVGALMAMVIGTLTLKLAIFESTSLKDKRRVLSSLKQRLGDQFNASVAEIGSLDHRQQAELGLAVVANNSRFVESCLDKIVDFVRQDRSAVLVSYETELF